MLRQRVGMPRQPRFWYPGAVLHVVQRGHDRAAVFLGDSDRRRYLDWLVAAAREHGVAVHAYVLMPNHVHLLASPATAEAMPRMMQTLGRRYVGWFNHVHRRTGTLWEGRYKATLVDTDAYFLACMRYVELNPVRAHLVVAASEFRWSSHRANAFGASDALITRHGILRRPGGRSAAALRRLSALVRSGAGRRRAARDSGGDPLRVGARKRRASAVRRDADPAQSQPPCDGSSPAVGESRL
jgi:putative transposase